MKYIQLDPLQSDEYIQLDPLQKEEYIKLDPLTTAGEAFGKAAISPTIAAAAKAEDTLQTLGGNFTQGIGELLQYTGIIPEPPGGGTVKYARPDPLQKQREQKAQQVVKEAREASAEHPVAGLAGTLTGYVAPWLAGGIPGLTSNVMQAGAEQSTAVKAYGGTEEEALKSGTIASGMSYLGGKIPLQYGSPALQRAVPTIGPRTATAITAAGTNAVLSGGEALIQNELLKAYPELQTDPLVAAGLGAVVGGGFGAIAGKGTKPLSKEEEAAIKGFDVEPTPEVLAKRIKEGNLRALRGIENDIHATHERSFNTEQQLNRVRQEIETLSGSILKSDPETRTKLLKELEQKKAREESLSTRLNEDELLTNRNEIAYRELAAKLGVPYVDPVTRAQNYKVQAHNAKSVRATRRALISEFRAKQQADKVRQADPSGQVDLPLHDTPTTVSDVQKAINDIKYKNIDDTRLPRRGVTAFGPKTKGVGLNGTSHRSSNTTSPFQSSDEVVAALKGKFDIDPVSADLSNTDVRIMDSAIPLLQKIEAMNNPAVTYAVNVIYNARNRVVALRNKILGGAGQDLKKRSLLTSFKFVAHKTSFQALANKSSPKDFFDVSEVFLKGENRLDYEANLRANGGNLTQHQKDLYRSIAKVYEDTWAAMNDFQLGMGKKHLIPNKLGYIAPIRRGDYAVTIKGGVVYARGFSIDEDGVTRSMDISDTSYIQRFFTLKEANEFINSFNKLPENIRNGQVAAQVEKMPQIENLFQLDLIQGMREAAVEAGADSSVIQRMDQMIKDAIEKGGTIGSHHKKQMGFIEGGKGRELFASKKQQGESFRESIIDYVKETTRQIEKAEVQTRLDDLITHPEMKQFSNTVDFITSMKNYHINADPENPLDAKGFKGLLDEWWTDFNHAFGRKGYHPKAHVSDSALGKATHAFYLNVLTSRPSFWVAQGAAFTVSFRSLVKDQGLLAAHADIANGFNRFLMNDSQLFDYFKWAKDNTSALHPEFINDLTKFGLFDRGGPWVSKLLGYLTGETESAAMDSFSRALTASFFLEHYLKKGLKGKELYVAVSKATDENMVQYGKAFKAPVYSRLGVIGDLIAPLASFSHTQLVNFANDLAHFKRNPSYQSALPAMVTFVTSLAMGGALGVLGAAEIELLIHAINYLLESADVDYRIPTLWETVLGSPTTALFGKENKVIDRTLSHGIPSASTLLVSDEGYHVGSSLGWRPIVAEIVTGDKNWASMVPVLPWAADYGGALYDAAFNREKLTPGERREVARKLAPGWTFGFVDATKFDSFGTGPQLHPKNDPDLEKSKERAIARFLGTKTIEEHKLKFKRKLDKELTNKLNAEARTVINRLALNGDRLTQDQANQLIEKLSTKYGKNPGDIFSAIQQTLDKASVSYEKMPFGKSLTLPTQQELNVQGRYPGQGFDIEEGQ